MAAGLRQRDGEAEGCAYLLDTADGAARQPCAAPLRPGSSYCPAHHALCHLAGGSAAEAGRLREVEKLANAVGGRRGGGCGGGPSQRFLDRLERAVRDLS